MVYEKGVETMRKDGSEVDSTESLWYSPWEECCHSSSVLKLTPPSHYGIGRNGRHGNEWPF